MKNVKRSESSKNNGKMVRPAQDERLTVLQSHVCGGIAGVLSRTVTSPLEVVKVLAQVGTPESRFGFVRSFKRIYQNEGLKAFWKGNGISCLRLAPYSAIQLAAFHELLAVLEDPNLPANFSGKRSAMAAFGSALIASLLVYPTEMLKTRLIVQPSKLHYHGILHGFRQIWRAEGFFALYKGILPTFLGMIPFAGGSYLTYTIMDNSVIITATPLGNHLTPVYMFVSGCLAAAVAKTLSFPFDTIRKKMQAKSKMLPNQGGIDVQFKGMTSAFNQTVKVNGVSGLWRGMAATLLKIVPNAGIMFLSFEYSKRFFLFYNGYTKSPFSNVPKSNVDQSMSPNEVSHHYSKRKGYKR